MPDTYNLEGEADTIAIGVETFEDIEESITRYIDKDGNKRWHFLSDDEINGDCQYAIYFGHYSDDDPIGQPHNSFVTVFEIDESEELEEAIDAELDRIVEEIEDE